MNENGYRGMSPQEARKLIRQGGIACQTSGMCEGYAQANLCAVPKEYAYDFLLFAVRNPQPCPLLEVADAGSRIIRRVAPGADVSSDIPRYRVYENGVLTRELADAGGIWRDDLVAFLIGCSFSFESALLEAGVPVRNIEEGKNVPMYDTCIPCEPAGVFRGNMVVSMRPMSPRDAVRAVEITSAMPHVHGSPVHIGDPAAIGIRDLSRPDYGDPVEVRPGEIPVFWACGVTPQAALMASRLPFAITHAPGHMLITDIKNSALEEFLRKGGRK